RHHRARGIVDRGGRLPLRPIDRAVGGGIVGRGARPFPEAHCRTSKTNAPPSGAAGGCMDATRWKLFSSSAYTHQPVRLRANRTFEPTRQMTESDPNRA